MKRPDPAALNLAAEWLDHNEGDEAESGPMQRVAEWLRFLADKQQEDAAVRKISRQSGASMAKSREALRKVTAK